MLKENFQNLIETGVTGDWCFSGDDKSIIIKLPNQPEEWDSIALPIFPVDDQRGWAWNGNRESPTLTPSILINDDGFHGYWHGFLTNGKLISV